MRKLLYAILLAAACATTSPDARHAPSAATFASGAATALIHGDYAWALDTAERGLAVHPGDPWLLYDKGAAQAGMGRLDEALETLRQAEQRFTTPHERSLAVYRRAIALELAGRCAEASTDYARYAALVGRANPTLADDAMAHVKFCLPPTPQQVAERQDAEALGLGAADAKAHQAEELSTLAVRALAVGDYQLALAKAEAGLKIVPDDPWLLYNKGTALAGLDRTDESLATLRRAERLFSSANVHGRSVAIYRRAMALEAAGRCEEEADELQRYAQLAHPSDPEFVPHALAHVRLCKLANAPSTTF